MRYFLLILAGLALAAPGPARAEAVSLTGTWHVLIHYTDANSNKPEQMRWDDKVWVFEPAGSRLRWAEYPIVVFGDKHGRFTRLGTSRASRVLHGWEPNEGQLAQIRSGLEVNDRGSKSKTLRRSDGEPWRSQSRARPASAMAITYVEHWSIEGSPELPTFRREDVLGSGVNEDMEGVTLYTTTAVEGGGDVLRGTFGRDATRRGSFRLMRAGPVEGVKGSGKTQGERVYEVFFGDFGTAIMGGEGALRQEIERRAREGRGGELPEDVRAAVREDIRRTIEARVRDEGGDPARRRDEIDSLTLKIEQQILEEGRTIDEVGKMLEEGRLTP